MHHAHVAASAHDAAACRTRRSTRGPWLVSELGASVRLSYMAGSPLPNSAVALYITEQDTVMWKCAIADARACSNVYHRLPASFVTKAYALLHEYPTTMWPAQRKPVAVALREVEQYTTLCRRAAPLCHHHSVRVPFVSELNHRPIANPDNGAQARSCTVRAHSAQSLCILDLDTSTYCLVQVCTEALLRALHHATICF